ncbi:interferon-like [Apus apus]|uniref:interferon-like n=1 Tax=Apus apus TaxID=8895 RepID=UPI0021F8E660|nr:interferon-like [Apus apus]XP_051498651.1 interferon-like [Apus apus]XP_051498652.1 interferon-like [Apus apus]XP_051498654.1 interferon-like [Apus apus]
MAAPANPQARLCPAVATLLLLLTPLATATACHHLRPRDDTFSWDNLQLLQAMAPSPPQPCHHQPPTPFPDILLHTHNPGHAAAAALRILNHLLAILSSSRTPPQWDAEARHELLNNLEHYIHHLQQCFPDSSTLLKRHGPRNLLLNINKNFTRIQNFLLSHHYSACAWEHVRLEAHTCFQRLDALIRQMKSKAAPDLHQTHPRPTPVPSQHRQDNQRLQQPGLGLLRTAPTSSSQETAPTGEWA